MRMTIGKINAKQLSSVLQRGEDHTICNYDLRYWLPAAKVGKERTIMRSVFLHLGQLLVTMPEHVPDSSRTLLVFDLRSER